MPHTIHPDVLFRLRTRMGWSPTKLHQVSKVSRRQIYDIEGKRGTTEAVPVREFTLRRLAGAFKVSPEVLAGEVPLPEHAGPGRHPARHAVTVRLSHVADLHYELVRRRYGVSRDELIENAPLLFTLLAEDSLRWRTERVRKARELFKTLGDLHGLFGVEVPYAVDEEGLEPANLGSELESIAENDVFGEIAMTDLEKYDRAPNPFAEYLARTFGSWLPDDTVSLNIHPGAPPELIWDVPFVPPDRQFPEHALLRRFLWEITGGDFHATFALRGGAVSLRDIPSDLWGEDQTPERIRWILARAGSGADTDTSDDGAFASAAPEDHGPDPTESASIQRNPKEDT